ncbi:translocator protein homolog [Momordica charantia]|uniref:Translocator protein homolog n=1 Tax=Momordica charantia TaxID=3673 RepID=A0A6J1DBR2_MOMCH|nr:translocator protein homolog [Momordica charantia]
MASPDLKHRKPTESDDSATATAPARKPTATARRGLKSLAVAVSVPVSLSLLAVYLLSDPTKFPPSSPKPFWFPSAAAVNLGSFASSLLMGAAVWLVWADGGFHSTPNALYLYTLYVLLCFTWYGLLLGAGAPRLAAVACLAKTAALVGCDRLFRRVNPIAADLVKPCLAWSVFLTVVNLTMVAQ